MSSLFYLCANNQLCSLCAWVHLFVFGNIRFIPMIYVFYHEICNHQSKLIQCRHSIIWKAFNWQRHNSETIVKPSRLLYMNFYFWLEKIHPYLLFHLRIEFHSLGQYLYRRRASRKDETICGVLWIPSFGILNPLMWPSNQLICSLDLLKSYHWIRWCDLWICLFELWVCSCDPWIRSNWYNQFSIDLLNIWFHSFATGGKFASTHPIQKLKAGIQQEGGDAKKINLLI